MFSCGLVSVSFRSLDIREILSLCKRAGLSLVEWGSDIHAPCKDMERLELIARLQREKGVSCSSYGTYFRLGVHPVEELEDYILAAKILGTRVLRIWCGDRDYGDMSENERQSIIKQGKRAAAMAEREGVVLCAECHPKTFTVCLEGALALMKGVDSPAMRMYWQPNQYVSFEENCEYAKKIAPYVYNLHVFHWEGKNKYPLADGADRWTAYLSYFRSDCTLLLEFMPDGSPQTLPREAEALRRLTGEIDCARERAPAAGVCIDPLLEQIRVCVRRHELGAPGHYARWLWGTERNLGLNEYGCADAANILYTLGDFPRDSAVRRDWICTLQNMQEPTTGLFREPTHHPIHTTAHCLAALELFDASPLYPCYDLQEYTTKEGLYYLLEQEVDWQNPWPQSHKGAGIFPCLTLTGTVGSQWKQWYFDWFWEHADEENGFFYGGEGEKQAKLYEYMAGGFHYIFNHESEHRPLRYPERIIDSCLWLMENAKSNHMIQKCTFIDVDVVYSLNRAMRQTPYRFREAKQALERYADAYLAMLQALDYERDECFNDLHLLFGSVCCLAELQAALPGKLISAKPLRLVLDRRPFV